MRRILQRMVLGMAVALTAAIGWFGWLQASGNFHPVVDGLAYRSAQMRPADLGRWKDRYGIASVLNLRGRNIGQPWYDAERRAARDLGMTHVDFRMSASRALTPAEAARLIAIMRAAPKPLLIHCMGGADRTGLASALFVAGVAGGSERAAEWQLSPRYGHLGLPVVGRARPMDQTWEALEHALGFPAS